MADVLALQWFQADPPIVVEWIGQTEDLEARTAPEDLPGLAVVVGPRGPKGDATGFYMHTQSSAASTWTVAHNLGYRPLVTPLSVGGLEMIGTVLHLSENTLEISFEIPISGSARLV